MKSAWMPLMIITLSLGSMVGCAEDSWRPLQTPPQRVVSDSTPVEEEESADSDASDASQQTADVEDPQVDELNHRIEDFAGKLPDNLPDGQQDPAADQTRDSGNRQTANTTTAPADDPADTTPHDTVVQSTADPESGTGRMSADTPLPAVANEAPHAEILESPEKDVLEQNTAAMQPVTIGDHSDPDTDTATTNKNTPGNPDDGTNQTIGSSSDSAGDAHSTSAPAGISESTDPSQGSLSVEIIDVRPVLTHTNSTNSGSATSPNQPADADTVPAEDPLIQAITALEEKLRQQPPHPQDQFRLRLLYLAAGEQDKATAPFEDMDPIQSELLSSLIDTIASTRKASQQPSQAGREALTAARELTRLIGQQSGIVIPRIALVTRVSSFGDYEPIRPLRFPVGQEIHAYIYSEIANFHAEPTEDKRLRTLLSEKVEVYDAAGKCIWQRSESNIEDRVRTPRHDFFIPFPMHLPADLDAGQYVLKVTIEDLLGGTTDQQRLTFTIQ